MSDRLSYLLTDHTGGLGTILVRNRKHPALLTPTPNFGLLRICWSSPVPLGGSKIFQTPPSGTGAGHHASNTENLETKSPGAGGSLEGLICWGAGGPQLHC